MQQFFAGVLIHFHKRICRHVFGQNTEQNGQVLVFHFFEHRRHVRGVHRSKQRFEHGKTPLFEQADDFFFFGDPAHQLFGHVADHFHGVVYRNAVHHLLQLVVAADGDDFALKRRV